MPEIIAMILVALGIIAHSILFVTHLRLEKRIAYLEANLARSTAKAWRTPDARDDAKAP